MFRRTFFLQGCSIVAKTPYTLNDIGVTAGVSAEVSRKRSVDSIIILRYRAEDIEAIQHLVSSNDSFVALVEGDLYRIVNYLDPESPFTFSAILDRNVYTRVTSLVERASHDENAIGDLRWAAAVLAFCQIAQIDRQPIPTMEKMIQFVDWMHQDFLYSSPALHCANRFFSPNRFARMLKGKTKRDTKNAAHDMAMVQVWRKRALSERDTDRPVRRAPGVKSQHCTLGV
jgi:hypothetical protein